MEPDYKARYELYKKLPAISAILTFIGVALSSILFHQFLLGCLIGAIIAVIEFFIASLAISPVVVQTDAILNIEKKLNDKEDPKGNIFVKASPQKSEPAVKEGQSEQYYRDLFKYGKISSAELNEHLSKIKKN